mgnify:FL=1
MKNKDSSKYFLVTNFSFEFLELFNNNNNNPKGVKAL